jgi:hypothetical protein
VRSGRTARHACLDDSSRSEVAGTKGTDDSRLEVVGSEPARTPRRQSAQRAAQVSVRKVVPTLTSNKH